MKSVASFVDVLRHRARHSPALEVYRFLPSGGQPATAMTCAELDGAARRIARALLERLRPGDRAVLLYPPGLDYIAGFFGCLYAGIVAVPAYPPEPAQLSRTLPRLLGIIEDCEPAAVLAAAAVREQAQGALADGAEAAALAHLPWIATDDLPESPSRAAEAWRPAPVDPRAPAYLQYTSGSTGTPKGVMIGHHNLIHNSALIERRFGHTARSRGVIWLPPYHDMGLIGGILQPLYAGFPVTLMSHLDFLKHPLKWLRAISAFRATTSGGPNFAYDMLCSIRIPAAELAALDLSAWDVAFTGAEFVRATTLSAFAERFAPCGFRRQAFYPCYGMAENTLFATGGDKAKEPVLAALAEGADCRRRAAILDEAAVAGGKEGGRKIIVGCGRAGEDARVAIVDPDTARECPEGQEGEIWISGGSVAMGYWRNPTLSEATFQATIADGPPDRFLRTGDLGIRLDAEIFVTGRIKDLIVVRGANHSPQDLEATVEELFPDLFRASSCAVFAAETEDGPGVVVVREMRARHARLAAASSPAGDDGDDGLAREIFAQTRQALSRRHGLAVSAIALVPPAAIPKTTSGKIQRHACRALFVQGALPIIAEWRAGDIMRSAPPPEDKSASRGVERDRRTRSTAASARAAPPRNDPSKAEMKLEPENERQA
ncbi:MAG TPA: fatty acyl-AMP ligase [Stellaceae bacterium]|nr:fatty acyl-AMP ligase [Stellaceae bacterium]